MFELVKTTTKDGLYLHGLLNKADKTKYAILHIHGFEGDFYSDKFLPIEAEALKENGHTFLSVETRGTASEKEIQLTDNSSKMYGSHYELLKDSYLDIDAWIEFLMEKGYHNIILQGYSLGCDKVVRYFAEGSHTKHVQRLLLISPADTHGLAQIMSGGKYLDFIKVAKDNVAKGRGEKLIDSELFTLRISYQTALSRLTMDHFGKMFNFSDKDNNFMLLNKIDIPVKVIVGSKDEFINPVSKSKDNVKEAMDIIKLNIRNVVCAIIQNGNHRFEEKEHELTQEIVQFVEN